MATKSRQRKRRVSVDPGAHIRRLLEKGDAKQALKDSKVLYRQEPGPESRQLLEQAYLARARQLSRAGLRDECRATLEGLLELGATDASVQAELPKLLIAAGLFDLAGIGTQGSTPREAGDPLLAVAADHAVLRPREAPQHLPAIAQGARAVRRAIDVLADRGDAEAALAELKDIPSGSPLADWRLFVRGLAAYYREDTAQMQANWQRLAAGRAAARIATALRALADPDWRAADDDPTVDAVARLGRQVFGCPLLESLERMQGHVAQGRWPEVVRSFPAAGRLLAQVDPDLPTRVATILMEALVHKGDVETLEHLAAQIKPLPIDPHWNRALALATERSPDDDPVDAERYWRAYLDDLAQAECLGPADRTLAQALVWLRLGGLLVNDSDALCPSCGVRHDPDKETQADAIECFENALRLSPGLLVAYQSLADAYAEWAQPDEAAATYRRLVERFPENLEGLRFLANHYLKADDPITACAFVSRAQRLKPLDPTIRAMVAAAHLELARHHILAGRWEEGGAELATAEQVDGHPIPAYHLLAYRAALEFKAGDFGLGHRLIDQAAKELGVPAPAWFLVTVASTRCGLPKAAAGECENRWRIAMNKGRRSAVAGRLCTLMTAHLASGVCYRGQEEHLSNLLDYLRHCLRIRWQADDLHHVLEFLLSCQHRWGVSEKGRSGGKCTLAITDLLEELGPKARKSFPDHPFFHHVVGELEIIKGPEACNRVLASSCFRRVLELVAGRSDSESVALAKTARKRLDLLRDAPRDTDFDPQDDDPDDLDEGGPFAFDQEDGDDGPRIPVPPGVPEKLFGVFVKACRTLGLDPEQLLEDVAAGKPLPFLTGDGPPKKQKKHM